MRSRNRAARRELSTLVSTCIRKLLLTACLLITAPFAAADTLDDVLKVMTAAGLVDPAVADAREMIDCIIDHNGDTTACFNLPTEAEKQAGKAAATFMPEDPKVQGVVKMVLAVQAQQWVEVIEIGGLDVMFPLACTYSLSPSGPIGQWICSGPFKEVMNGVGKPTVKAAFGILTSNDGAVEKVLQLIPLLGNVGTACKLVPVPGVDELCGFLGKIIAEIGGMFVAAGEFGAKLIVEGADAAEKILFGDDSHMPYDQYYGLYWLPWLHKATNLCVYEDCQGQKEFNRRIWDDCVDYFDSHNQYRSTAEKTCDDMRNKRFTPSTRELAKAIRTGARVYVRELQDGARAWAITEYGKNNNSGIRQHFLSLCETELEQGYPLTTGNPAICAPYQKLNTHWAMGGLYDACMNQVKAQQVNRTAWRGACKQAEPEFVALLQTEQQRLQDNIGRLTSAGCTPPAGWTAQQGLKFECGTYGGYDQCREVMFVGGNSICKVNRASADAHRAKEIHAYLGAKRCTLKGNEVLCHRPWKKVQCDALVKATPRLQPSMTSITCTEESSEYYKIAFANKALLDKLNAPIARGGQNPGCEMLEDKAKIRCLRTDNLQERIAAKAEFVRSACGADPNYDGADESCYMMPFDQRSAQQQAAMTPLQNKAPAAIAIIAEPETPATRATPAVPATRAAPATAATRAVPAVPAIPATECATGLTYLVPQPPVVEASVAALAVGDQLQIRCRFVRESRRVRWEVCDDNTREAAQRFQSRLINPDSRFSGIVAVDGDTRGVDSSPLDQSDFETVQQWKFDEPGTHTISCRIDNPMRFHFDGAETYLDETISVEVVTRGDGRTFSRFEPQAARPVPTSRAGSVGLAPGVIVESPRRR
ncbi:MAG: hypothetical protein KDI31_08000 [Pseudomonadales bacterium]|nr:hypothetical protein [Pseudomonadales bacterium]